MCIVSSHGIHRVLVSFCFGLDKNTRQATSETTQLLRNGLWPATWNRPETAFTIELLSDFEALAKRAQVTGRDYFEFLRQKTSHADAHELPVRVVPILLWPC